MSTLVAATAIWANASQGPSDANQTRGRGTRKELVRKVGLTNPTGFCYKYKFRQRYFAFGDGTTLKLKTDLQVSLYPIEDEVEIAGWGIRVPAGEMPNLSSHLCRRFLEILQKGEAENLTDTEQVIALNIMDQVDFRQYSIDHAQPRRLTGVLEQGAPIFQVRWDSGESQRISPKLATALSVVRQGEAFSAFVKFGHNDEIIYLKSVTPFVDGREFDNQAWEQWPPAA